MQSVPIAPQYVPKDQVSEFAARHAVLGAIHFTTDRGDPGEASLRVPIPQLASPELVEVWTASETPRLTTFEDIRIAETADVLFGRFATPSTDDLEATARRVYATIGPLLKDRRFPHLLRMWNQMSRINEEEASLERYRRFCAGRFAGFEEAGWTEASFPAASGVGTDDRDAFAVYFIATRRKPEHFENPRQVAAYHYPRRYGPKSPSFARATSITWDNERQIYIAGTASVVGHLSMHVGDLPGQFEETFRNIEAVIERAGGPGLDALSMLKVYLRDAGDVETVRSWISESIGDIPTVFLRSDICRAELLIEIEGVCRL